VNDAEELPDRELRTKSLPGLEFFPCPSVHPHLAALVALAVPHEHSASTRVHVGLGKREGFADSQAPRQSTTINARRRTPPEALPAARITAMISSTIGGSAG
jgi:hypothetical protein